MASSIMNLFDGKKVYGVLILVLMEWLQAIPLVQTCRVRRACLNPCSDGMASSFNAQRTKRILLRLNPCSDGMASSSDNGQVSYLTPSLNPCSDGMASSKVRLCM